MYPLSFLSLWVGKKKLGAMGVTPTIDRLKVDCNSFRTEHAFRYLFEQDEAEVEMFVTRLEVECEAVRARMLKYGRLVDEGQWLSPFDMVADDAIRCTMEGRHKDALILNALNVVLQLAREAKQERHDHVTTLCRYG